MKKLLYILILLLSLNLYCEKSDDAQSTPIQNQSQSEAPIPQKNINGVSIEGFISEEGSNITNSYESNFTLSAPEKCNVTADTFITVRGTNISCSEIRFYVYNESISEYRYLQTTVTNTGSYEDHVYLRYGQGDYIIFIFLVFPGSDTEYQAGYFYVTNTSTHDFRYFLPSGKVQCFNSLIMDKAKEITSGIVGDENRSKALHDWIVINLQYDYENYLSGNYVNVPQDALTSLTSKKAVCDGYSNLYAAFLRALGIEAKYIIGDVTGGDENHAWNEVYWSGSWHIVDVTWDDPLMDDGSGNLTSNFPDGSNLRYTYFDISPAEFANDHTNGEVYIPRKYNK